MNIIGIILIIYLIVRYLQSSGNSPCENVGRQMTDDIDNIWNGFWSILDGCIVWGSIGLGVIFVIIWLLGVIGNLLGFN